MHVVEYIKFTHANITTVVHGAAITGQHAVYQRSSLQSRARLVRVPFICRKHLTSTIKHDTEVLVIIVPVITSTRE